MTDFNLHGNDLFGEVVEKKHSSKLGEDFLIPPFSVLSAREGWRQERKRAWLSIGIESELGRGENLASMGGQSNDGKPSSARGGLTWGDSPQVTEKGLNFYRRRNSAPCQAEADPTVSCAACTE